MMSVTLGGLRLRASPWLLLVPPAALLTGKGSELALVFLLLLGHELAHVLAAVLMGVAIEEIEIWPLGGRIHIHFSGVDPAAEILVILAGPFHNLMLLALSLALSLIISFPGPGLEMFLLANLALAGFNLLPFLPLDGGRAVLALLASVSDRKRAIHIMKIGSRALGALLAAAGLSALLLEGYSPVGLTLVLLAGGAALSAGREADSARRNWNPVLDLVRRRRRGRQRIITPVVVPEHVLVRHLVATLSERRTYLLWVEGPDGTLWGPVSESQLLDLLVERGVWARVGDIQRGPGF